MSFPKEGEFLCQIVDAEITFPKFPVPSKNDLPSGVNHAGQPLAAWYDVCLKVQDADGNFDYWHGEMSNRTGKGNFSNRERWEQTLDSLCQIGFNVNTMQELMAQFVDQGGVTKIPNLIGIECLAVCFESDPNENGKTFVNLRFIKSPNAGKPQGMSMAQLTQMFGGGQQQQQQQQAPTQQQGQQFNQPVQQQQQAPVQQNQPQQQQTSGGPATNPYAQQ